MGIDVDIDLLTQLETLAALEDPNASPEERAKRSADLSRILEHVRTLEHALDADALDADEPSAEVPPLRIDEPRPGIDRAAALAAAPHADETVFVVPRIMP